MAELDLLRSTVLQQAVAAVLTHAFEKPIPPLTSAMVFDDHQRLVDEVRQQV